MPEVSSTTGDPLAIAKIRRAEGMQQRRGTFESHWEDLRLHFNPSGRPFNSMRTPGAKAAQHLYDDTGVLAARELASAFVALTTNPATIWFNLTLADRDPDDEEAEWLEYARDQMLAAFASPKSRFTLSRYRKVREKIVYGTGVMAIFDRPGKLPLCKSIPLSEMLVEQDAEENIDTNYRWFQLSARLAYAEWGDAAGPKVVKAVKEEDGKRSEDLFRFLHATEPRGKRDISRYDGGNKPIASCWINVDEKLTMKEHGYEEPPYITSPWDSDSGETYGRTPAMDVLPTVKLLQRIEKAGIQSLELTIRPPLLAADDGVMSPISLKQGAINTVRWDSMQGAGAPVRPMLTGSRPDIAEEAMEARRARVRRGMLEGLFNFARDPRMTATQVIEIRGQVQQQTEPLLGFEQTGDLGPTIDRMFPVMQRAGLLYDFARWPEYGMPESLLSGAEIKVEYQSPLFKARNVDEARAMIEHVSAWQPLLGEDQQILSDNIDLDDVIRRSWMVLGAPRSLLRSIEQRDEMRKARAAEAQKAVELERAQAGADTVHTAVNAAATAKEAFAPEEAA